jgi:gliding motility-associated-like protein
VIDPEMPGQIAKWGGNYATWQSNVQDMKDFILARCSIMNNGFIPCYPALSGPYNATVEIIGIGEVEMSDGNIINQTNTPQIYSRFGGVALPFKVKSGPFDHWEVISSTTYVYDPNADTLVLDLQNDITVKAYFIPPIPTRDITYNVTPLGTSTTINVNGTIINTFPTTITYTINDTINISPNLDPLYGFSSWSSDSVTLMPMANNPTDSFYATNHDNVTLRIYELPTIVAFIAGDDSICSNDKEKAEVSVSFSGVSPFTFIYAINGVNHSSVTTTVNPYIINTSEEGIYTLISFSDANEVGWVSGSALVTIRQAPTALFTTVTDTLSILYPSVQLNDVSIGNITDWSWNFGDNTPNDFSTNPFHSYKDSIGIYQLSLIVADGFGCSDTTFKQLWIADEYWMYIPNSFTPDLDGVNDVFCLTHHGVREETFHFNIYNRFSNLVYATENIDDLECFLNSNGWDGKHYKTGNDLPMGTYIYEVYFQDFEGWKHQDRGHLFIIR